MWGVNFFGTQGDQFRNSFVKTSFHHSSRTFRFWHTLVMITRTISLEYQVANLTKLVEGLSTSLKKKNHKIRKLMNKHQSINEGG